MDSKVQQFLEENKELLHKELLDSLGLYEYEKEYMPDNLDKWQARRMGYDQMETTEDGEVHFYKHGEKIYPQISDEEYESLLKIAKEKERIEAKDEARKAKNHPEETKPVGFNIIAENASDNSFASKVLRILAWFFWIGGLIASIFMARVEVINGYRTETVFQWGQFFTYLILYISLGVACMCMAELHANVYIIASAIQRFHAKEEK